MMCACANGDGNVDANDLKLLNDNQSTSKPSGKSICDIGPMPWGDGVVDKKDIEVFMEYWKYEYATGGLE
ncbi:MAG: hypothetical protein JW787_00850 [Sedimentisphaerales bacterium]|nr:hypothetical protein [Sedimentisphaerales bacterium]